MKTGGLLPEDFGNSTTAQVAVTMRMLLLELTTQEGKMVSGNYPAQRAAGVLALQPAADEVQLTASCR